MSNANSVADCVNHLNLITANLLGRRVREDGYYNDGVGWTGSIANFNASGVPVVKWDEDGSMEPVPASKLTFLDHGEEDEAAVRARILGKFRTLERIVSAVARGQLTGAIIEGQGGVGKTHTVEKVLCDELGKNEPTEDDPNGYRFHKVTGKTSPLALYDTLYEFSGENDIVVFDDCDSVWGDANCINLLKAALDTHPHRILHWNSKSRLMTSPQSFVFRGRILFLTNVLPTGEHFDALRSRTHNISLHMTPRELMYRIEDIVTAPTYEYKETTIEQRKQCLSWMVAHIERFKVLNVRVVLKLIDYYLMGEGWEDMAFELLCDYKI